MKSILMCMDKDSNVFLRFFPKKTYVDSCQIFYRMFVNKELPENSVSYSNNCVSILKELYIPLDKFNQHIVQTGDVILFKPTTYTGITYLIEKQIDVLPYCTFLFERNATFSQLVDTTFINSEECEFYLQPNQVSCRSIRLDSFFKLNFFKKRLMFTRQERKLLESFHKDSSNFLVVHLSMTDMPKIISVTNYKTRSEIPYSNIKNHLKNHKYLLDKVNLKVSSLTREEFMRLLRCNVNFDKYCVLVQTPSLCFTVHRRDFE
jgi:hypothetical protein